MLKRIRDLFSRRGKRPPRETASLPSTGDEGSGRPEAARAERGTSVVSVHRGPSVVHRPIPVSDLDPDAVKILRRLTRFQHTAYLVGGCVRDLLLARRPKDFDIGTSATPRQVKRLFTNCRIIGRRFRLAHIYFQDGKIIEVATFRARDDVDDGEPHPGQDLLIRDDNVFGTAEEDALRRDFTINSLFYDVNSETVIDHADGLGDLRRRLVRTIGDPAIRFREDPIRILRAIKFAARLDFEIEPETLEALRSLRQEVPKAATARILEEINRFCRGGAARASFELLRATGVFDVILPEFARAYREGPAAEKLFWSLLDALDERNRQGHDASTGEILAILLLPLIAPELGWNLDGSVADRHTVQVRELADRFLRPMSLRLRASRRDQEESRQILLALHRMVPAHRTRRGAREAIRRRPCFSEATWILEAAAILYGGVVAEAASAWRELGSPSLPPRRAEPRGGHPHRAPGGGEAAPAEQKPRRRRRGPRHPSGEPRDARAAQERAPQQAVRAEAAPPNSELPPPWDDGYFFAALPTAAQVEASGDSTDRYGAAALAGSPAGGAADPAAEGALPPAAAARKKRSRRRRSRKRPVPPADGADGGSNGAGGDAE